MLYQTLRATSRVALHWYYSDIIVQWKERIPACGPLLVAANHPNALVDALLVATVLDRRVVLTAKATLFEHPVLAMLLAAVDVIPLRRTKDELLPDHERNTSAFQRVTEALGRSEVVLIFPEGISHDEPALAPLRTGAARMALEAHAAGVRHLYVLPVGLVFEEKERPRSRVLVRVGEPLNIDAWSTTRSSSNAVLLTREIDARLRRVTLNFATSERARRAVSVAASLAAIATEPSDLDDVSPFALETEIASRVELVIDALESAPVMVNEVADRFTDRLTTFKQLLHRHGVSLSDARISLHTAPGARFLAREGFLVLLALPVAVLGRVTHWLPLRLARAFAIRSAQQDPSRDQPAMRTIIIGLVVVLAWYGLQAVLVTWWLGVIPALAWLTIIFIAAHVDLMFTDRIQRAWRRTRTYLALRRDSRFRAQVLAEIDALLADALHLEQLLVNSPR